MRAVIAAALSAPILLGFCWAPVSAQSSAADTPMVRLRPQVDPRLLVRVPASEERMPDITDAELRVMVETVGYFSARAEEGQMVCLSFLLDIPTTLPAPRRLVEESVARWTNVTTDECPRTYDIPFTPREEPPPGHIDPNHLSVGRPVMLADAETYQLLTQVTKGSIGNRFVCSLSLDSDPSSMRCRVISIWVS